MRPNEGLAMMPDVEVVADAFVEEFSEEFSNGSGDTAPTSGRLHPATRVPRQPGQGAARSRAQLMPTLFDRLRDEAPSQTREAASDYTLTPHDLREIIQRDLAHLLNATNAEDLIDRARYPEAAASTVNFGMPPLTGGYASERKWEEIERVIRRAIADYEPRLLPESVSVVPLMKKAGQEGYNVLVFEIRALIAATPYPLALTVQSSVDLETSRMNLMSTQRGPARTAR